MTAPALRIHPAKDAPGLEPSQAPSVRKLVTVEAVNVEERPVRWLWRDRLVHGALNLIEGPPEAGKTAVTLDIVSRFSRGRALPDGQSCDPLRILVLGAEDDLETVVRPRMRVAGADLNNVRFVVAALSAGCSMPDRIVLPNDLALLREEMRDRDFLFVDSSINDFARTGMRSGDDVGARELMGGLGLLATETGKTVLATRHLRKGGSRDPIEAGSGTMGVIAKTRSVMGVFRDPTDPARRLLARVKCNLSPNATTLACRFTSASSDAPLQVEWLGTDPRDAREILTAIHQAQSGTEADPSRARRALAEWLSDGQWAPVKTLKDRAAADGLSWKAIEKAKAENGVQYESRPELGWCWRDPWASTRGKVDAV